MPFNRYSFQCVLQIIKYYMLISNQIWCQSNKHNYNLTHTHTCLQTNQSIGTNKGLKKYTASNILYKYNI